MGHINFSEYTTHAFNRVIADYPTSDDLSKSLDFFLTRQAVDKYFSTKEVFSDQESRHYEVCIYCKRWLDNIATELYNLLMVYAMHNWTQDRLRDQVTTALLPIAEISGKYPFIPFAVCMN